jgi:hypothetical protein
MYNMLTDLDLVDTTENLENGPSIVNLKVNT